MSFPHNHHVAQFFMKANPGTIDHWMGFCVMETTAIITTKLHNDCANVYTNEQTMKLKEIMDKHGRIVAENMCLRTLLGVGCECNDFQGNPLVTSEDF